MIDKDKYPTMDLFFTEAARATFGVDYFNSFKQYSIGMSNDFLSNLKNEFKLYCGEEKKVSSISTIELLTGFLIRDVLCYLDNNVDSKRFIFYTIPEGIKIKCYVPHSSVIGVLEAAENSQILVVTRDIKTITNELDIFNFKYEIKQPDKHLPFKCSHLIEIDDYPIRNNIYVAVTPEAFMMEVIDLRTLGLPDTERKMWDLLKEGEVKVGFDDLESFLIQSKYNALYNSFTKALLVNNLYFNNNPITGGYDNIKQTFLNIAKHGKQKYEKAMLDLHNFAIPIK